MVEWAAEFPDLPGCVGAGDTVEEAVAMAYCNNKESTLQLQCN